MTTTKTKKNPASKPAGTSRQVRDYDTIVTRRADGVREKLDQLAALISKELGVPVKNYTALDRAVTEALARRSK